MRLPTHHPLGIAAALCLTALALAAAGCGDSDDDAGDNPAAQSNPATTPATGAGDANVAGKPALTGDRKQAAKGAATIERVYGDLSSAADAGVSATDVPVGKTLSAAESNAELARMCDLMSKQAQRQTIVYAKRSAGLSGVDWTCEKATGLLLRRVRQTGGLKGALRAEVVRVDARGDRATATIRFGAGRGQRAKVELVREGGAWKLAATPGGQQER
jgi:hypothetical protein